MSRSLGPALPADLLAQLSQADLESQLGRAMPFAAGSRSARNLEARRVGTLLVIEPARTVYVKCRARGAARRVGDLARFTLAVEDVLDDRPAEAEGDARIASGITYRPRPSLDAPWARAVLDALRAEG